MKFITIIEGAYALLHSGGVYRQVELYARGDAVYAKYGGGFVRLGTGGTTSAPKVKWSVFDVGETAIITEKNGSAPKYEGTNTVASVEAAE